MNTLRRSSLMLLSLILATFWLGALRQALNLSAAQARGTQLEEKAPVSDSERPSYPDSKWVQLLKGETSRGTTAPQADLSVNLNLTSNEIAGHVPLPIPVNITVTREGEVAGWGRALPVPDENGFFYLAAVDFTPASCPYWGCPSPRLAAGDIVWVSQGSFAVSMTVPVLTALPDSPQDRVTGEAPANASLTGYLFPFDDQTSLVTATLAADSQGKYQLNWPALRPRDDGYLLYEEASNRRAYVRYLAPFLAVQSNGTFIGGQILPGTQVIITLTSPSTSKHNYPVYIYSYSDSRGYFGTNSEEIKNEINTFSTKPGTMVNAEAGGVVFSTTVQTVTAQINQLTGTVLGEASPGAQVELSRFTGPVRETTEPWDAVRLATKVMTSSPTGHYSATFALGNAEYGIASVTGTDGHQSFDWFLKPYLHVDLGWHSVARFALEGQVDSVLEPITVAVAGPSGYLKSLVRMATASNGYFPERQLEIYPGYLPPYPPSGQGEIGLALESGDQVTVTTRAGVQMTLILPTLTAEIDLAAGQVSGQAPPGARLLVELYYYYENPETLVVTATVDGGYLADFSSLGGIDPWETVEVTWVSPEGHAVTRRERIESTCPPEPASIQVGGNEVYLYSKPDCQGELIVRLRDSLGNLKDEVKTSLQSYMVIFQQDDPQKTPIPIEGGDILEREFEGDIQTWEIPPLTVDLDPAQNLISGEASPGTVLGVSFSPYQSSYTVTVNAQGQYSLTLPANEPLEPGVQVYLDYQEFPRFYAHNTVPILTAWLYDKFLNGFFPPLSVFTLTFKPSEGSLFTQTGYMPSEGFFWYSLSTTIQPGDVISLATPAQSMNLQLPRLTARLDPRTATVTGQAPAGESVRINLSDQGRHSSREVAVNASGLYTATFVELAPLVNSYGYIYYYNASGSGVRMRFAMPHWEVTADSSCVSGYATLYNNPVSLILTPLDGSGPITHTFHTNSYDSRFSTCFGKAIQPGDLLTMEDANTTLAFTVPLVTAEHDFARQVLNGQAVPRGTIEAVFPTYGYYQFIHRVTIAAADGTYGLDTSDLKLEIGDSAYVVATDLQGNTVRRNFTITGIRFFFPMLIR